ncbi:MAG: hypothetical protein VYA34_03805 [Myxococcota bacterium]|nr:hypothetical protein [Myxococcota bacterium]
MKHFVFFWLSLGGFAAEIRAEQIQGGTIQVGGTDLFMAVSLESLGVTTPLGGELTKELQRIHGAQVRVVGQMGAEGKFVVNSYQIIEIFGKKPMVGKVSTQGEGTVLTVESKKGKALKIVLKVSKRSRLKRWATENLKVWVIARELPSKELKVIRYGLLDVLNSSR